MIRSLSTAVTGLRGHQTKLDIVGNNIANVNTVAFKKSQIRFEDLLSQTIQGATAPSQRGGINPSQVGMGMRISGIIDNHFQGPVTNTDRETDLAIQGNGYFIVSDGSRLYYTRDGSFGRDANGELVNINGYKLMGWTGSAADVTGELAPLHIPLGERMVAQATSKVKFAGNLDAGAWVLGGAAQTYNYEYFIYDSLGRRYTVEYRLTPAGQNSWEYEALLDGNSIGSGTLVFTAQGSFDAAASTINPLAYNPPGAEPISITPDFSSVTQLAGSSSMLVREQDGFPAGELVSFAISRTGAVIGTYTNGMVETLGQIAMAYFTNPEGLAKEGGNLYQVTANSGEARIGLPGTEGRGLIQSSALEMSNADLSFEFTELITTSRAFQANTRVVTTSDEILLEVINMKR